MVPLVSNKYKYIFFYNPKSACSVARKLFLDLHRDELDNQQRSVLKHLKHDKQDEWHSINQLFPIERGKDYSGYTKFTLVRHPLTRFVSAYLNRVVMQQMDLAPITNVLINKYGNSDKLTYSFNQFMDYFEAVNIESVIDTHFQPQAKVRGILSEYEISTPFYDTEKWYQRFIRQLLNKDEKLSLQLDYICKIETLSEDFTSIYQVIFSDHPEKLELAQQIISKLPLHNVTYTSRDVDQDACNRSARDLRSQGEMPSYQSFLTSPVVEILAKKYHKDFLCFNYSSELETSVLDFEKQKHQRITNLVPDDFDWQLYLSENADLGVNGIDTQSGAISHWIHHGRYEKRKYKNTQ